MMYMKKLNARLLISDNLLVSMPSQFFISALKGLVKARWFF